MNARTSFLFFYYSFPACTSYSTSIVLSVVLTFILTAVISVIISSLVTFLCTKSYYSKSQEPKPVEQVPMYEVVENIPSIPQTTNMSLTTNPAYGPVQH